MRSLRRLKMMIRRYNMDYYRGVLYSRPVTAAYILYYYGSRSEFELQSSVAPQQVR
jgi:hypothetical protein